MDPTGRIVKTFDRIVLALNRRISRGSCQRELPVAATLPEERHSGAVRRKAATVTVAVTLLVGVGTGGYWIAESQESDELGAVQTGEPVAAVCEARADAARAELVRNEADPDPDGGLSSMLVGAAEVDECRAELGLEAAELRAKAIRDRIEE